MEAIRVFGFSRLRPGVMASGVAHGAFFAWLAAVLAFHPEPQGEDNVVDPPVILVPPPSPPPPPPTVETKPALFRPEPAPPVAGVHVVPATIPVPAETEFRHPPSPDIIIKLPPIVTQPKVVSRTNPIYPDRAVDADIQGYVDIEGTVAPDGSFSNGTVLTEAPQGYGFASALMRVIPKWRFEPRTVNGTAVPYLIRYRFSFALKS